MFHYQKREEIKPIIHQQAKEVDVLKYAQLRSGDMKIFGWLRNLENELFPPIVTIIHNCGSFPISVQNSDTNPGSV